MARAALDHIYVRVGHELQHLRRLVADILRPGMACHMQRHAARQRFQPVGQALLAGDGDNIFGDIETVSSGHSSFSIRAQLGTRATMS